MKNDVKMFLDWLRDKRLTEAAQREWQEPTPREWRYILKTKRHKLMQDIAEFKRLNKFVQEEL